MIKKGISSINIRHEQEVWGDVKLILKLSSDE